MNFTETWRDNLQELLQDNQMLTDTDMQCFFSHGGGLVPNFGNDFHFKSQLTEPSNSTITENTFNGNDEEDIDLDMTCCICLENFSLETKKSKQDKVALLVQCGHFYHQQCMKNWLTGKETGQKWCPTCRTEVTYDMEIEIFPVEVLVKNKKSIMCLRQKHALRQKLSQDSVESELDEEDSELTFAEWVHVSLHPMESTSPIAIQHRHEGRGRKRPVSPFTIITADEIPSRSENEEPSQPIGLNMNNFLIRLQDNIFPSLPTPYLMPYDNWMAMR